MQPATTKNALPVEGRGSVEKLLNRIVMWVEKLNVKYSSVGNPPIYDKAAFPWVREIEKAYPDIKEELLAVLARKNDLPNFHDVVPGVSNITQDEKWKTFLFTGYGATSLKNTQLCPKTWGALQRIPNLQTAMFSIFEPGKQLRAHRGPYNGVLRLHLGLIVPTRASETAIRVADNVYHWKEGEAVIFDDSYDHEAWNHSGEVRVILFVDFTKPTRFPASIFNWIILHSAAFTSFIREAADAEDEWEKAFYGNGS